MAESFETSKSKVAEPIEGVVVLVGEKDVFVDCGFKSEVAVPVLEFESQPKVGDKVSIVVVSNTPNGIIGSRALAARREKIKDLNQKFKDGLPTLGKIVKVLYEVDSTQGSSIKIFKGFLVDLGTGLKGFLPASHVEFGKKSIDPQDYLNKEFEFKIIGKREGQFVLSRKELVKEEVSKKKEEFLSKVKVGDEVEGVVKKIAEKYLILDVEGVNAFLSINDFSWKKTQNLAELVNLGDKLLVKVLEINRDKNTLRVGKKQIEKDPFEDFVNSHKIDDIVQGKVILVKDKFAIVELEDGVNGIVLNTDLSWSRKPKSFREEFRVGDIVKGKIIDFNKDNRTIRIGIKQLTPDPWEDINQKYKKGQIVRGRVNTITDNFVFVGIMEGVEGILRKNEVSWKEDEVNLRKLYSKGQMVEALIIKVDEKNRLLHLSVKRLEGNPWERFKELNPKGSIVTGVVKEVRDDRLVIDLGGELEGFIMSSQISLERGVDHKEKFKVGDSITAMVIKVLPSEKVIELSIRALEKKQIEEAKKEFVVKEPTEVKKGTLADLLKVKGFDINVEKTKTDSRGKKNK
ncbi:MAG: S1 RNA-binding domain-containing protein [Brevinematia bacterium]